MLNTRKIAGVDEVGRGCLAGPVFAAAVILNDNINTKDIKDSKKLSNQIDEFINNKKRIMKWAGVSESYQSDYTDKFGDYPELLKEVNKLIKETSTKIKSELNQDQAFNKSSKNAENIYQKILNFYVRFIFWLF